MASEQRALSTTFMAIADYALATSNAPMPMPLWKVKLDDKWEFIVNGTDEVQETGPFGAAQTSHKMEPFSCYVEFNGWPAGVFNPYGGTFAAGSLANEEEFCKALKAAAPRRG